MGFSRFGFGRRLARTESVDFEHWSEPQLVLECDSEDGPDTQIYGAGVDIYEGIYLAMIWIYREGGDGRIDTQLATSRDGIRWSRVGDRATWLELGDEDTWEGGMVRSVERVIRRGNTLYIYYCGVHGAHTGPNRGKVTRKHPVQSGLLTQRRDGFVSLTAEEKQGTFTTVPFVLNGTQLSINADASDGVIRVEVLDELDRVVSRSQTISGDHLDLRTVWDENDLETSKGRQIRLRFTLRSAHLYSYWIN